MSEFKDLQEALDNLARMWGVLCQGRLNLEYDSYRNEWHITVKADDQMQGAVRTVVHFKNRVLSNLLRIAAEDAAKHVQDKRQTLNDDLRTLSLADEAVEFFKKKA